MRKTYMAICATAALGLYLTAAKDASAFPAAGADKVYAQSVAGKSAATPVRWAGRRVGVGRVGVGRVGVARAGGWGVRRVGVGYGVGWRGRGWGWRRAGWGWGPGLGLGLGWGGYYNGGWGWPLGVGLGVGWGYGGYYPATYTYGGCGCGGFF